MKLRGAISGVSVLLVCSCALSGAALSQAMNKQYVADFGAAFTQATVINAQRGFIGVDIGVGKMLLNNLSIGLAVGYDVCSFRKVGDVYERMAVIPLLVKAKYHATVAPMIQLYASTAGGLYEAVPHLNTKPIGNIWDATTKPGGAVGLGFNYWFLLTQGIGADFEYHFFDSGGDELFSYAVIRLNYSVLFR